MANSGITQEEAFYVSVWEQSLLNLLDWPAEKSEQLARRWAGAMSSGGFFYNNEPAYYVAILLAPDWYLDLKGVLSAPRFQENVQFAIEGSRRDSLLEPDFDWQLAKERVSTVLSTVGLSLEEIKRAYDNQEVGWRIEPDPINWTDE